MSLGNRFADIIRNGMGSWPFVFSAVGFLIIWIIFKGPGGIDPFPFILLNLLLSCLAALQGAILLIAAKRADALATELAENTYKVGREDLIMTQEFFPLIKEIHRMQKVLHDHLEFEIKEKNDEIERHSLELDIKKKNDEIEMHEKEFEKTINDLTFDV